MDIIGDIQNNWWQMPIIIAMVLVYAFLLNAVLFKPIQQVLQRRKEKSEEADKLSMRSRRELDEKFAAYEKELLEARRQSTKVKESARNEALGHRATILDDVRKELSEEAKKAEASLQAEMDEARGEVESAVPGLARMAAGKVLGREVPA